MNPKLILTILFAFAQLVPEAQIFNPGEIRMYWHDSNNMPFLTFKRLRSQIPQIRFITNVGSDDRRHHPTGLYVENGKQLSPLRTVQNPKVYYGIQPDGVFAVYKDRAEIVPVRHNLKFPQAQYAVQSAPMLVINGRVNPALPKGNITMRNGVGILADGRVYFACRNSGYRAFAEHFLEMGCVSALQLDYHSSQCWEKGMKTDDYGRFGILIGVE